jgi:MSHA biogenesis protein MshN
MSLINKVLTELDRQEKIQPTDDFSLVRDNTRLIAGNKKKNSRQRIAGLSGLVGLAALGGWLLLENPTWLPGLGSQEAGFRNTSPAQETTAPQATAALPGAGLQPDQGAGSTNGTPATSQTPPIAVEASVAGALPDPSLANTSSAVTNSVGLASAALATPGNTSTTPLGLAPPALAVATAPSLPANTQSPSTTQAPGSIAPQPPNNELRAVQAGTGTTAALSSPMAAPPLPTATPKAPVLAAAPVPSAPSPLETGTARVTPVDVASLVMPRRPEALGGESEMRALISQDPQNAAARQALASILQDSKRATEAADLLADGLMLSPDHLGVRSSLAQLWAQTGQLNQALNLLQDGMAQGNNDPQYLTLYGHLLMKSARHQDARRQYLAAVQRKGSTTSSWLGLATALQAVGDKNGAISAYSQALQIPAINPKQKLFAEERLRELTGN